jgi:Ni/Co efflux regulator RcnB
MERKTLALLLFAFCLGAPPVFADPPGWAGKGKHHEAKEHQQRHEDRGEHGRHFTEREYVVVREYYYDEFRRGKCPPGLAKKHNGCLPPGHAKKWAVGERLPREVVYYEVPRAIIVRLPQPSPGFRYVRVASDILLIAVGTGMIVDAVRDLGQM